MQDPDQNREAVKQLMRSLRCFFDRNRLEDLPQAGLGAYLVAKDAAASIGISDVNKLSPALWPDVQSAALEAIAAITGDG